MFKCEWIQETPIKKNFLWAREIGRRVSCGKPCSAMNRSCALPGQREDGPHVYRPFRALHSMAHRRVSNPIVGWARACISKAGAGNCLDRWADAGAITEGRGMRPSASLLTELWDVSAVSGGVATQLVIASQPGRHWHGPPPASGDQCHATTRLPLFRIKDHRLRRWQLGLSSLLTGREGCYRLSCTNMSETKTETQSGRIFLGTGAFAWARYPARGGCD